MVYSDDPFMLCFMPLFSEIIRAIDQNSDLVFGIEAVILLFIVHEAVQNYAASLDPAWINSFVIGMLYARAEKRKRIKAAAITVNAVLYVLVLAILVCAEVVPHERLPYYVFERYGYFVQYGHVFLGLALVAAIRWFYHTVMNKSGKHPVLDWSDKYSYDVYLVHHVFVNSAFACVEYIPDKLAAIPLAIVFTVFSSMLLHAVSAFIRNNSTDHS